MYGKEFVFIKNTMEMKISARWGHWGGGSYQSEIRRKIKKTYLSEYWVEGKRKYLNVENMSAALKFATTALNDPSLKGIPIDRVDTYSLRSGGANAQSLAGYNNRDIQKMWRRRCETFKEYIREELHFFAEGMSTAMKQDFKIFSITGGVYIELVDVTITTVVSDYQPATE